MTEEIVLPSGERQERKLREFDGREIYMPSILERALICRRLNWAVLPDQLKEADLELQQALHALSVFDAVRMASQDLSKLGPHESKIYNSILNMRESIRSTDKRGGV